MSAWPPSRAICASATWSLCFAPRHATRLSGPSCPLPGPITSPSLTARRLVDANFTIPYCFAFLRASAPTQQWSGRQFADFIRFKSANVVCASIDSPMYHGHYTHGTAFQAVPHDSYRRWVERVRRLAPQAKSMIYFHCFIDVLEDADRRFADARLLRPDGSQADYGEPHDKIFLPLKNNSFGPAIAENVDVILDEIHADGVYWDELEYSAYRYHYGQPWDGCSADIGQKSMKIARLKSSVALLTQPWPWSSRRISGPRAAGGQWTATHADHGRAALPAICRDRQPEQLCRGAVPLPHRPGRPPHRAERVGRLSRHARRRSTTVASTTGTTI